MMRGGSGTGRRYLFLRSGATVIATGGEYDADLQVGYRTVEFALPHGQGTVELHVDTQVAGLLIAALAGGDMVAEVAPPEDVPTCHMCGDAAWPHLDGLAGGRWVCAGRPGCDASVVYEIACAVALGEDIRVAIPVGTTDSDAVAGRVSRRVAKAVREGLDPEVDVRVVVALDEHWVTVLMNGREVDRYVLSVAPRGGAL